LFLLEHFIPQDSISRRKLLHDIFEDLIQRLVDFSFEENIFAAQPCRDNTLYLLQLMDEMLVAEIDHKILVCGSSIILLMPWHDYTFLCSY
jgi:hypothetical protein